MSTEEMALWPSIRENSVQITATSLLPSNSSISKGNGTVIFAENNHVLILTGGESIASDYYTKEGNLKVNVEVSFADDAESRLFDGASQTKYQASILTDLDDAKKEVVLLHVNAPFNKKNVARFSNSEITDCMGILMCANFNGHLWFSNVSGNISSRNVPGTMVGRPGKSYVEYAITAGAQITGAGLYDLTGGLIGIHSHQIMVKDKYGIYGSPFCRGILAVNIYPIIVKLLHNKGVTYFDGVDAFDGDDASEMLRELYRVSYGSATDVIPLS